LEKWHKDTHKAIEYEHIDLRKLINFLNYCENPKNIFIEDSCYKYLVATLQTSDAYGTDYDNVILLNIPKTTPYSEIKSNIFDFKNKYPDKIQELYNITSATSVGIIGILCGIYGDKNEKQDSPKE